MHIYRLASGVTIALALVLLLVFAFRSPTDPTSDNMLSEEWIATVEAELGLTPGGVVEKGDVETTTLGE